MESQRVRYDWVLFYFELYCAVNLTAAFFTKTWNLTMLYAYLVCWCIDSNYCRAYYKNAVATFYLLLPHMKYTFKIRSLPLHHTEYKQNKYSCLYSLKYVCEFIGLYIQKSYRRDLDYKHSYFCQILPYWFLKTNFSPKMWFIPTHIPTRWAWELSLLQFLSTIAVSHLLIFMNPIGVHVISFQFEFLKFVTEF